MQCTFSGSTDSSIRRSVAVKESLKGELNYMSENDYKLKYEINLTTCTLQDCSSIKDLKF